MNEVIGKSHQQNLSCKVVADNTKFFEEKQIENEYNKFFINI